MNARKVRGEKFLCSHCRSEQYVMEIEHKGLKECLCPGCHQHCCDDYCLFFYNGRWNMYDAWDDDTTQADIDSAREAFERAYDQTKREYGLL